MSMKSGHSDALPDAKAPNTLYELGFCSLCQGGNYLIHLGIAQVGAHWQADDPPLQLLTDRKRPRINQTLVGRLLMQRLGIVHRRRDTGGFHASLNPISVL